MVIPAREVVVGNQINNLLMATGQLLQFVSHTRDVKDDSATVSPIDGGVKASVEVSLMKLLSRLDAIVESPDNWTMKSHLRMEDRFCALMDSQREAVLAQKGTSEMLTSPHMRYSPQLIHLDDGSWAAFIGDLNSPKNLIAGRGACPAEAMEDFDREFRGTNPVLLQAVIDVANEPITQTNNETHTETVDAGRDSNPAKVVGENREQGDRKDARAHGRVRGRKSKGA